MKPQNELIEIFDFDGTLDEKYKHEWLGEEFNWDTFINRMDSQPVIRPVMDRLVDITLNSNIKPVVVTARPLEYRMETISKISHELGLSIEETSERIEFIFRPSDMIIRETKELGLCETEDEVKVTIFRNHKMYRDFLAKYRLDELFGIDHELVAAYDDQGDNLDTWREYYNCPLFLIDGQLVSEWNT